MVEMLGDWGGLLIQFMLFQVAIKSFEFFVCICQISPVVNKIDPTGFKWGVPFVSWRKVPRVGAWIRNTTTCNK
jgi:hypothetical protein